MKRERKAVLNKVILIGILVYFIVFIEISIYFVLNSVYIILTPLDFIAMELFVALIIFIVVLLILKVYYVRLYFSLVLMVISAIILIFFFLFQSYNVFEFSLLIVFIFGIIAVYFYLRFFKPVSRMTKILLFLILLGIGNTFLIFISFRHFFLTKIQFLVIFILSALSFRYNIDMVNNRSSGLKLTPNLTYLLIGLFAFSSIILFLPIRTIELTPKNKPQLIFWTTPNYLPTDNETLELFQEYDMTFDIVIREKLLDGTEYSNELLNKIQYLVNHSIDYYVSIGGNEEFYCSMNNADHFIDYLKGIRSWLKDNNIYDSCKGFDIDAESPKDIIEELQDLDVSQKLVHFFNSIPSKERIERIELKMQEFIDLIHEDHKKVGIVKLANIADNLDGDNDFALLTQNIYGLDLDFDFSVSMLYRTQHVPNFFDYIIEDLSQYDYTSEYQTEYLQDAPIERYLMTEFEFFFKAVYEIQNSEVKVPQDKRYVFIGTFSGKFRQTSYIQNKEYLTDIDILRHFDVDKIYFFTFREFIKRYGKSELEDLGKHIQKKNPIYITFSSFALNREIFTIISYSLFDRFLYI